MSKVCKITLEPEPLDLFETIYEWDDAGDFAKSDTYGGNYRIWVSNAYKCDIECQFKIPNPEEHKTPYLPFEIVFTKTVPAKESKRLCFVIDDTKLKPGVGPWLQEKKASIWQALKLELHVKAIGNSSSGTIRPKIVNVGRGVIVTEELEILRSQGVKQEEKRWMPHRSIEGFRGVRKTYDPSVPRPTELNEEVEVIFDKKNITMVPKIEEEIIFESANNMSNVEAKDSITRELVIESSETWEYQGGFTLQAGSKFKAGLPAIVDGELSFQASTTHSWKSSTVKKESKKDILTINTNTPPKHKEIIKAVISFYSADIPYSMTNNTGKESKGVLRLQQYAKYKIDRTEELASC